MRKNIHITLNPTPPPKKKSRISEGVVLLLYIFPRETRCFIHYSPCHNNSCIHVALQVRLDQDEDDVPHSIKTETFNKDTTYQDSN